MPSKKEKKMVIVESPAKARTISRFLGTQYVVEFCLGHIRDLPSSSKQLPDHLKTKPWARFGVNLDNNFSPVYCIPEDKKKVVKNLKKKLQDAKELILATDEDREGESISWHLKEILNPKVPVKRMVFHEITKSAIQGALNSFREIDSNLVQAQEARRILDRLVGYSISPFLWKKVTRGLSAGRVQSVAVSIISERELKRMSFKKTEFWDIIAEHKVKNSLHAKKKSVQTEPFSIFKSRLISHKGKKIINSSNFESLTGELKKKNDKSALLLNEKEAEQLAKDLKGRKFKVTEVEKKSISRKPPPPFITSTLQQECNRKLGLSSRQTMNLAQKLYEQGLITYMRTDSVFLSHQALQFTRLAIKKLYGESYIPEKARVYSKSVKGAQEAHEAIRPAGDKFIEPKKTDLNGPLLNVYDLIWKRTLASQMKDCLQNQIRIKLQVKDSLFISSGMNIEFPGFYSLYRDQEANEIRLPDLREKDEVPCSGMEAVKHETKPPARYTEASLIQKLEKEGVGRPSTYASIIGTIQERGYIKKEKNALIPTFTALIVTRLLQKHFPDYVDIQFTSEMEKDLDEIARGKKNYIQYLKSVYYGKKGLKKQVEDQEQITMDKSARSMVFKGFKEYSFHVGPFGAYVSKADNKGKNISATLPPEIYPGELNKEQVEKLIQNKMKKARSLGKNPQTGEEVFVLSGRYGPYVQTGEKSSEEQDGKKHTHRLDSKKSKRISLSPFFDEDNITLKDALKLLELPKLIGIHPETKKEIKKGLGRFGPYIVHNGEFRSVPRETFFDLDLKSAVQRLNEPKHNRRNSLIKDFKHPSSGKTIYIMKGRYGPYIKYKNTNYSLPDNLSPDKLELDKALNVINDNSLNRKREKKLNRNKGKRHTSTSKSGKKVSSRKANKRTLKISDKQHRKKKTRTVETRRRGKTSIVHSKM